MNDKVMSDTSNNKSKWLHIRLSRDEYETIHDKYSHSTCRKLSEYARRILLDKVLTMNHRNQSLDDFMSEMIRLRNELNGMGNNFNQAVKKLHTLQQIEELKPWIFRTENDREMLLKKQKRLNWKIHEC